MSNSSPDSGRKPDRRIERTKALLRDALLDLIAEKGYDQITISDIADRANVARTTFYLHYADKDDLLFRSMREIYESLFNAAELDWHKLIDSREAPADDYLHVAEYADFYRIMLSEKGSMAFFVRVLNYMSQEFYKSFLSELLPPDVKPRVPLDLLAYQTTGAQLASIMWWLQHDQPHSPEEMASLTQDVLVKGMAWSLGMNAEAIAQLTQQTQSDEDTR